MPWPMPNKIAQDLPKDHIMVINLSGRGDKDVATVAAHSGLGGI